MYWRQGIAKFKLHCIAVSILSNAYVLRVAYFILSTMYIDSLFSELCDTACQHMCITAWMGIQPQSSDVTAIIWFAGLPHAATLMKDSQRSNSSYHNTACCIAFLMCPCRQSRPFSDWIPEPNAAADTSDTFAAYNFGSSSGKT